MKQVTFPTTPDQIKKKFHAPGRIKRMTRQFLGSVMIGGLLLTSGCLENGAGSKHARDSREFSQPIATHEKEFEIANSDDFKNKLQQIGTHYEKITGNRFYERRLANLLSDVKRPFLGQNNNEVAAAIFALSDKVYRDGYGSQSNADLEVFNHITEVPALYCIVRYPDKSMELSNYLQKINYSDQGISFEILGAFLLLERETQMKIVERMQQIQSGIEFFGKHYVHNIRIGFYHDRCLGENAPYFDGISPDLETEILFGLEIHRTSGEYFSGPALEQVKMIESVYGKYFQAMKGDARLAGKKAARYMMLIDDKDGLGYFRDVIISSKINDAILSEDSDIHNYGSSNPTVSHDLDVDCVEFDANGNPTALLRIDDRIEWLIKRNENKNKRLIKKGDKIILHANYHTSFFSISESVEADTILVRELIALPEPQGDSSANTAAISPKN